MAKSVVIIVAIIAATILHVNGGLIEMDCPVDCHCYLFRINPVTDCSESNLTSIQSDQLSQDVYILDANGNHIKHVDPFPTGIKLRRLQIAHNELTKLSHESFAGLTLLIDADFSYNAITHVDPDTFSDSPGFITLELQHNPLAPVEGLFLNSRTLLFLDLSSCGIRHLNNRFFHNTTNLKSLDMSNNPLERIEPGPFDVLGHLESLKLKECNLTFVSPQAFAHLENLRELEMSENKLTDLSWTDVLAPLIRLEQLDIGNTGIRNLPSDAFAKNHYLRELVLGNNEFDHLDVGNTLGHNLHNLQSLDLSNCKLRDSLSEEAFKNASQLRDLNLSGNPMFAADLTSVLRHLPTLHKLSLSNCSLRKLPNAFDVFAHLEELDISHNPLSDAFVGLLNPLKSLKFLDMSYCDLGYVGNNTFAQMTSLKKLILSGNKLHTLEQGLFRNLTRLASLELNNCDLKTPVDPRVFGDRVSTNVVELKLSGNPLTVPEEGPLMPPQLAGLEILDLSNCNLDSLNQDVLSSSPKLTFLNLSGNKLSGIKNFAFLKNLRNLEHLDLSDNSFAAIHPRVFSLNPHLLSVNLMGNPFVCDCSIVDMWRWAVEVKNDLHVLVGSQPSEFAKGAAKLRKSLSCTYSDETFKNIINRTSSTSTSSSTSDRRPLLRKGDLTPIRTWPKYLRESNCPPQTS